MSMNLSSELDLPTKRRAPSELIVGLIIVLLGLGVLGGVGKLTGGGWFGYRLWLYERGELYVLNMGPEPLYVSVDGRKRVEVIAENARLVDLVGGTSEIVVTDKSGTEKGRYPITIDGSHAFLKLTDDACLTAVHMTPYYGQKPRDMELLHHVKKTDRVWIPGSRNVVWPRKKFPKRLRSELGKGIWLELVACELQDEETMLKGYLDLRLRKGVREALNPTPPPPTRMGPPGSGR